MAIRAVAILGPIEDPNNYPPGHIQPGKYAIVIQYSILDPNNTSPTNATEVINIDPQLAPAQVLPLIQAAVKADMGLRGYTFGPSDTIYVVGWGNSGT